MKVIDENLQFITGGTPQLLDAGEGGGGGGYTYTFKPSGSISVTDSDGISVPVRIGSSGSTAARISDYSAAMRGTGGIVSLGGGGGAPAFLTDEEYLKLR